MALNNISHTNFPIIYYTHLHLIHTNKLIAKPYIKINNFILRQILYKRFSFVVERKLNACFSSNAVFLLTGTLYFNLL